MIHWKQQHRVALQDGLVHQTWAKSPPISTEPKAYLICGRYYVRSPHMDYETNQFLTCLECILLVAEDYAP